MWLSDGCTFSSCSQNMPLFPSSLDCYLEYSLGCKPSHIIRWEQYPKNGRITRRYLGLCMTKSWLQPHCSKIALGGGDKKDMTASWPMNWSPGNQRHPSLSPIFGMWVLLAFRLPAAAPSTQPWDNDVVWDYLDSIRQYTYLTEPG